MMNEHLTVSQLVHTIKQTVNQSESLKNVALIGELSNFKPHYSGHFYFTMKDENTRIDCVMFASNSSKVKFQPKDGDKVIITGYCDVYLASGKIQMYAQTMSLDGLGDLHIRFEELKKKLHKEGYFDPSLKKQLKSYPESIAVICGKNSAAHADITKTLKERWPLAKQYDIFAYVQGENAVGSVMDAIKKAWEIPNLDTIILSRGGGSIEDLWAFNNEELVKMIVSSKIPIICAIGHESDTTLAELASDYRAATPTAAVVAAVPSVLDVRKNIRDYMNSYYLMVKRREIELNKTYSNLIDQSYLSNPERFFGLKQQNIDEINMKFTKVLTRFQNVSKSIAMLESKIVHDFDSLTKDKRNVLIKFNEESYYKLERKISFQSTNLQYLQPNSQSLLSQINLYNFEVENKNKEIKNTMNNFITNKQKYFISLIDQLDAVSPLKIMSRGFSIVSVNDEILKSIDSVEIEDILDIRLQDGIIKAEVNAKKGLE